MSEDARVGPCVAVSEEGRRAFLTSQVTAEVPAARAVVVDRETAMGKVAKVGNLNSTQGSTDEDELFNSQGDLNIDTAEFHRIGDMLHNMPVLEGLVDAAAPAVNASVQRLGLQSP